TPPSHPPYLPSSPTRRSSDLDEFRRLSVTPAGREALQDGQMILENLHRPKPARSSAAPGDRSPSRSTNRKSITQVQKLPASDAPDRKSTRLNSSHEWSSYAVF